MDFFRGLCYNVDTNDASIKNNTPTIMEEYNMKRKFLTMLALVLALTTLLATGAMAANVNAVPTVRVNGEIVEFPDGQPFVDENNRTMIPVRFVTEALGAKVGWDGSTQTVSITKDGVVVTIKIGSPELTVTANGKSTKVQMDTAATARDGRTYVPIRYVAEALGAKVDYSSTHGVVGIYNDTLTIEEINKLQAYAHTAPERAITYAEGQTKYNAGTLEFYYGNRTGFDNFANAREHLYHTMERNGTYYFRTIGKTLNNSDTDTFFKYVVDEAIAEVNYKSERMTVTFHADESCIYQGDGMDRTTACVRGIVEVKLNVKPTELEGAETAMLCDLGFTQLYQGQVMYIDVDVHMNTQPNYNVNIHSIVPLDEAY